MPFYWWIIFAVFVLFLLALDLGLLNRGKTTKVTIKQALWGTALRVGLALLFNLGIYLGWIGSYPTVAHQHQAGLEFLTGYLVEMALSVDNVFVFALMFKFFSVSSLQQQRVLIWGVIGAVIMRAVLIFAGIALIEAFSWVIYIFAMILIYGGIKMMRSDQEEMDPEANPVLKLARRWLPITDKAHGDHFFVREKGILYATPLFIVLLVIETSDLLFAVDSIPAVIAITRDSFLVFTSNIFAILGLRALYFALAGSLQLFHFLHYGLSAILIFIGMKMLLSHTAYKLDTVQSLVIVGGLLVVSVVASLLFPKKEKHA
ncbi:MAG: TerC family protein [Chthoniobacterales bacterium]